MAIDLYTLARTKGGVDDRLIAMGLGESYALSGDKVKAVAAFKTVTGEVADLAKFWVIWVNLAK